MKKADNFEGQRMIVLPKNIIEAHASNAFSKNISVTDIGYFPKAKRHFRQRKQGCNENILIICEAGKGRVEINGKMNTLDKNQFIIIPKEAAHYYLADTNDPWSIYWIHFTGDMAQHFVEGLDTTQTIANPKNTGIENRVQLFNELFMTLEENFSDSNLEYSSILLSHLLGSLKYPRQYNTSLGYNTQDKVTIAINFMKDNLSKMLSLSEIANASELSISQISLRFKNHTNKPPLEYFTFLKIQKACQHLSMSDQKVKEIAIKLGYTDAYYFSRVFTKVMGISPANYRKKEQFGYE